MSCNRPFENIDRDFGEYSRGRCNRRRAFLCVAAVACLLCLLALAVGLSLWLTAKEPIPTQRSPTLYILGATSDFQRVLVYNFTSQKWSQAASFQLARPSNEDYKLGVVSLNDQLFAISGRTATTQVFKPAEGVWSTLPSMYTARNYAAFAAYNGRIYAIGGLVADGPPSTCIDTVETFDPLANRWTPSVSVIAKRFGAGVGVLGDDVFVVGGRDCSGAVISTVEKYDAKSKTWSPVTPMGTARAHLSVAVVNGRLFAIGGVNLPFGDWSVSLNLVEVYDPIANVWSPVSSMSVGRSLTDAVALHGLIYVVGGWRGSGPAAGAGPAALDTIEVYNPRINTWSVLPDRIPIAVHRNGAALIGG